MYPRQGNDEILSLISSDELRGTFSRISSAAAESDTADPSAGLSGEVMSLFDVEEAHNPMNCGDFVDFRWETVM
jgi:hypothetical protein